MQTKLKIISCLIALTCSFTTAQATTNDEALINLFKIQNLADVTGVQATAGAGNVVVSWTAVTGANAYTIYYSTTSVATAQNYAQSTKTGNVTTYTVNGLTIGTKYYFAVAAEDTTGAKLGSANYSTEVSATPIAASAANNAAVTSVTTNGATTTTGAASTNSNAGTTTAATTTATNTSTNNAAASQTVTSTNPTASTIQNTASTTVATTTQTTQQSQTNAGAMHASASTSSTAAANSVVDSSVVTALDVGKSNGEIKNTSKLRGARGDQASFTTGTIVSDQNGATFTGVIAAPKKISATEFTKFPESQRILKAISIGSDTVGLKFSQPYKLMINIGPQNYSGLQVYYLDTATNTFVLAGDGGKLSADRKSITVTVDHMTTFAVLKKAQTETHLTTLPQTGPGTSLVLSFSLAMAALYLRRRFAIEVN